MHHFRFDDLFVSHQATGLFLLDFSRVIFWRLGPESIKTWCLSGAAHSQIPPLLLLQAKPECVSSPPPLSSSPLSLPPLSLSRSVLTIARAHPARSYSPFSPGTATKSYQEGGGRKSDCRLDRLVISSTVSRPMVTHSPNGRITI